MIESVSRPFECLSAEVERWAALRIRGKWEKHVAELLTSAGVAVYLPLMSRVTRYQSRRNIATVPLFSGYLFVSESDFTTSERIPAITRRRIAQVLRPRTYPELRQELIDIAEFLSNRQLVQETVFGKRGSAIRVVGGPLRGCEGIIRKLLPDKRTIVVEVTFLGARVDVDLDESMLVAV